MSQLSVKKHPFHIVDPSPWPLFGALSAFSMTVGGVLYMHSYSGGGYLFLLGLSMFLYTLTVWSRDIVRESTYQGHHTLAVQRGLRYGMLLFIASEVMFFVAFFLGVFPRKPFS